MFIKNRNFENRTETQVRPVCNKRNECYLEEEIVTNYEFEIYDFNRFFFSLCQNVPFFVINHTLAVVPLPRSRFCRDKNGPIQSVARLNGRMAIVLRILNQQYKRTVLIPTFEFDKLEGASNGEARSPIPNQAEIEYIKYKINLCKK